MRRYFWMLAVFAFCILTLDAAAQVTKGESFRLCNDIRFRLPDF